MDIGHLQPVTLIDEFWRRSVLKSPVNKREKFPMVGVIRGGFFHTSSLCYFVKTWLLLYLPLEHQQMTKTGRKILGQVDDTFTISFGAWRPESVRVANCFFFYVARIMDYFNNSITPRLHSERTRTGPKNGTEKVERMIASLQEQWRWPNRMNRRNGWLTLPSYPLTRRV